MIDVSGSDLRHKYINEIKSLQLPIFVWGGGTYTAVISEYLKENGINQKINIVVDDEFFLIKKITYLLVSTLKSIQKILSLSLAFIIMK